MEKFIYSKQGFLRNILKTNEQELPVIEHSWYVPVKLKQNNGKERIVYTLADSNILAIIQGKLNRNFFNYFYCNNATHGFVQGRSYRTFLEPHVANSYQKTDKLFLKLDIKDFFHSITKDLVKESIKEYFKIDNPVEKKQVLNWTVDTITLNKKLPMGARTSPIISNLVFRRIDARISKYCFDTNITYTRYADDLLFSSYNNILHTERLINLIIGILKEYNLELNFNKIRRGIGVFSINGFVISDTLRLSRTKMKSIRGVLFALDGVFSKSVKPEYILEEINNSSVHGFYSLSHLSNYLAGQRSFLIAWTPNQQTKFQTQSKKLIERIDNYLEKISRYI